MTRKELVKAKKKLKKIVAATKEYACMAYAWDMAAEDDYKEWEEEIEAILLSDD